MCSDMLNHGEARDKTHIFHSGELKCSVSGRSCGLSEQIFMRFSDKFPLKKKIPWIQPWFVIDNNNKLLC